MASGSTNKGSISLGSSRKMYVFPQNTGKNIKSKRDKTQIPDASSATTKIQNKQKHR